MPTGRMQTFGEFLAQESGRVDLASIAINLVLAAVLAFLLARLYIRFGRSLSDRRAFAAQFVMITVTTAMIIVVVKTSLALSLGLVGALSIVRFRSAVREHEELAFLFFAIGMGLCVGADQIPLALLSFALISLFLILRGLVRQKVRHENLYVRVRGPHNGENTLESITEVLTGACTMVKLKRCDINEDVIETSYLVEFHDIDSLNRAQTELKVKAPSNVITFIDGEGIA